jgi:putative spermidine/putrescine transport system permease protein
MRNDRNAFGVLFLQTWKNMPFALLLLSGALQSISDDTLDAARDLGANIYRRYTDIIIPLTISAMTAAAIIIFIGAFADFTFQALAGPTNRFSLSQLMVEYRGRNKWNEAATVGVTLIILSFLGAIIVAFVIKKLFKYPGWFSPTTIKSLGNKLRVSK